MDPIDEVDIDVWIVEAVKANPGFGLERLVSRLHQRFGMRGRDEWSKDKVRKFLRRVEREKGGLLHVLENESLWEGGAFRDPMDTDNDGVVADEEIAEYVRFHNPDYEEEVSEVSKLKSNKHRIAWHLAKKFELEGGLDKYYSQWGKKGGGSSIKVRFWSDLISSNKMGLSQYMSNSRQRMAETIFIENGLEWVAEKYAAKTGGGVNTLALLELCDHFDVDMPGPLWKARDAEEEDMVIVSLKGRISPLLESREEKIGELVREFAEGQIFVPEFQRQFTWTVKKQRLLIDSILTGIPLPSILLIREEGGDWWLVDGQQRVTTLRRFIHPQSERDTFDLGILGHPNGRYSRLKFSELPEDVKDEIRETPIPVTRIKGLEQDKRAVYTLFHRYNTGGESLNAAEIRHAVFHENKYHREIFRLAGENQDKDEFSNDTRRVREAIGARAGKAASKYKWYNRVSRFFGYCYSKPGASTTDTVLEFFEDRDSDDEEDFHPDVKELKDIFLEAADLCEEIYGKEFKFKKLKKDSSAGSFGDIPYTMQMVSSRKLLDEHRDQVGKIKKIRGKIVEKWREYYMRELFEQRQNSSNIWRWQREWYSVLEGVVAELGESDYEVMLATAQEFYENDGPAAVGIFLDSLGGKEYWQELHDECYKRGWC